MYYAHSGQNDDRTDWQPLPTHLTEVARQAHAFGQIFGLGRTARLAALFHDLGKYDPEFDRVLRGENVRVDHSTAGAAVLKALAAPHDAPAAELIGYAILGHHAGLPDKLNNSDSCMKARISGFKDALDPVWQAEVSADFVGIMAEFGHLISPENRDFDLSVAVRMLFSCLVDADFRDTEAFYATSKGHSPDRTWPTLAASLRDFTHAFDAHMAGFSADNTLNTLRHEILTYVRAKAAMAPGLFTLTVPTGGGKTLASLGFALDHARLHGASRIIYAIPFTSIIDQTAAQFKDILGADMVLEHHSAIEEEADNADGFRKVRDKLRLAKEDWAAPVVVTTNVQLFESLFAARTGRARKLHNIAGSIIILDEAQTIPRPLLMPCVRMLDTLARHYRCTIVLCTATQPALGVPNLKHGLPLEGRELAPDPHGLATKLRRARIVPGGEMDIPALVQQLITTPQALVIVNSRVHALDLWKAARAEGIDGLVHLTTRQYAADRRAILKVVKQRLLDGLNCRVLATSLIEAGVDIDFPRVWRAEAGLDQIVQAAGRCNREGKRPVEDSIVTVFSDPAYPPPREIAGLIGDMGRIWGKHDDVLSLDAISDYFHEVYWRVGAGLDAKGILGKLSLGESGSDFAFRTIAKDFQMIESGMVPVIIPGDQVAMKAVADLGIEDIPSGKIARDLQVYTVQVPPKARAALIRSGHATYAHPKLRGDQFVVLAKESLDLYHPETGLWWEHADYLSVEQSQI